MKDCMKTKVAVVDNSTDKLKLLQMIEDLSKEYRLVVVPKTVVNKINNTNEQLRSKFLRIFLMNSNVIIRDYIDDIKMFDFALHASKEFKCQVDIVTYYSYDDTQSRYTVMFI